MFPQQNEFPEFVADQLLTSEHLNQVFNYLDEQERMTRTNLLGIGIVCGLEVKTNNTGTSITITKGCGVTSEGYLVSMPESVYTEYRTYDPVKERYYDRFVNIATKTKKFNLFELVPSAVFEDSTELSNEFLKDKVVLIFVELLEEQNKNCDPNSCDDKGINVTVTFRPLLVSMEDAKSLIGSVGGQGSVNFFSSLPEINLHRFDVTNTNPVTTGQIFDAYKSILSKTFIESVQNSLSQAYLIFSSFTPGEYNSDPFDNLADDFAFLNDGSISQNQLLHIQYFYDLFSDIRLTYEELKRRGSRIISMCCPDSGLFPRHLLLGEAIPLPSNAKSAFRHYFIYSPLFGNKEPVNELKLLFKKLALLRSRFTLPAVSSPNTPSAIDPFIKITPSKLSDIGLSDKAIPYYYEVKSGTPPLFESWNYENTSLGKADRNLSYHADKYSTADSVLNPLKYDLEPYNFLRVEGIIGKQYVPVLRNIKKQIIQNRLPINVIALGTDDYRLYRDTFASLFRQDVLSRVEASKLLCHFQDLEALYETTKNEILCMLCKELKYYYDLRLNLLLRSPGNNNEPAASKVTLFDYCSKGYIIQPRTFGVLIEKVYERVGDEGELTIQAVADALGIDELLGIDTNSGVSNMNPETAALLSNIVTFFEIPISIIRLSTTFTADLNLLNADEYCALHKRLSESANRLKFIFSVISSSLNTSGEEGSAVDTDKPGGLTEADILKRTAGFSSLALKQTNAGRMLLMIFMMEDFLDHLDVLIYNCKCSNLKALKNEYLKRYVYLTRIMQFGYYTKLHPGIQHKAGVPLGGTFIVVYHRRKREIKGDVIRRRFQLRGTVIDEDREFLAGAKLVIKGTSKGAATDSEGRFTLNVNSLPATLEVFYPGFEAKEIEIDRDDPLEIIIGDQPESVSNIDRIPEGTVIADFYLPYLCCSDCSPIQFIVPELTEQPQNQGPIANAGPDITITLPANNITLNGSASTDPDGTITNFQWLRLQGPGSPNVVTPNSAQTDVTALIEGIYVFELTVTDDKGAMARDEVNVSVLPAPPPPNEPPVANAGEDRTIILSPTNPLILDGTGSFDTDGTIVLFKWTLVSGPNIPVIASAILAQTFVTNLTVGQYEFQLTVVDDRGASSSDTVVVTVERGQAQRSCQPVNEIIELFRKLESLEPGPFNAFREVFSSYPEVDRFFGELEGVANFTPDQQIDFFAQQQIIQLMIKWLNQLQEIISANIDLRLLALALYRILIQLAMYIVCIQQEDITNAKIPMAEVFKVIQSHIRIWISMIRQGQFTPGQIDIVKQIGADIKDELARVAANGEESVKPVYVSVLKRIIQMIDSI